jgi:hypothetical protein
MEVVSISDAAFTGFRIVRERPKAVAVWAAVQLVTSLILAAALVVMAGRAFMRLQAIGDAAKMGAGEFAAIFQQLAPFYGLALIFLMAFNAVLYGAMNRAVMRPADDRFGYFRLGADELRQFGVLLLSSAVIVGVYVAAGVIAILAAAIVGLAFRPAAGLAVVLAVLAAICAVIFVAVKLSLASAQTFATAKVNVFGSWALTRGRFWPIFGTYVLAFALAGVVIVLGFVVNFALVAILGGGGAMAAMMHPDFGSLAAMISPMRLAQALVSAVLTALIWPIFLTPPAAIYLRFTAGAEPATGATPR